jgi:hypothetical protein
MLQTGIKNIFPFSRELRASTKERGGCLVKLSLLENGRLASPSTSSGGYVIKVIAGS